MMNPAQRNAIRAFWVAAFSGLVPATDIVWAESDAAKRGNPWVTISEVSATTIGIPNERAYDDAGTPTLLTHELQAVTYEIQCGARMGDTPSHAARAQYLLNCARPALFRTTTLRPLEAVEVDVMEVGDVLDISAVANDSQWETRASMTVVHGRSNLVKDTTTSTIESIGLTGTLTPVPGTVGPEDIGP